MHSGPSSPASWVQAEQLSSSAPSLRSLMILDPLAEVLRQHLAPGRPVVVPLGPPRVDPVGDAVSAERAGHPPRLAEVLGAALAGGKDDHAGLQHVEVAA